MEGEEGVGAVVAAWRRDWSCGCRGCRFGSEVNVGLVVRLARVWRAENGVVGRDRLASRRGSIVVVSMAEVVIEDIVVFQVDALTMSRKISGARVSSDVP